MIRLTDRLGRIAFAVADASLRFLYRENAR
jgi:hypothetical protein